MKTICSILTILGVSAFASKVQADNEGFYSKVTVGNINNSTEISSDGADSSAQDLGLTFGMNIYEFGDSGVLSLEAGFENSNTFDLRGSETIELDNGLSLSQKIRGSVNAISIMARYHFYESNNLTADVGLGVRSVIYNFDWEIQESSGFGFEPTIITADDSDDSVTVAASMAYKLSEKFQLLASIDYYKYDFNFTLIDVENKVTKFGLGVRYDF